MLGKRTRFTGDYTRIPRGRVFEVQNTGFQIMTGSWIDEYPSAKSLIIFEFDLQNIPVQWIQDIHWEIGHGWSDEFE